MDISHLKARKHWIDACFVLLQLERKLTKKIFWPSISRNQFIFYIYTDLGHIYAMIKRKFFHWQETLRFFFSQLLLLCPSQLPLSHFSRRYFLTISFTSFINVYFVIKFPLSFLSASVGSPIPFNFPRKLGVLILAPTWLLFVIFLLVFFFCQERAMLRQYIPVSILSLW